MAIDVETIREELKKVIDPELFVNVVDLGLIYDVRIEDPQESENSEAVENSEEAESADASENSKETETPVVSPMPIAKEACLEEACSEEASSEEASSEEACSEEASSEDQGAEKEARSEDQGEKKPVGKTVTIDMTLTTPACPAGPQLIGQAKSVLGALEEVGEVEVNLVMSPPWTPDRMTDDAKDHLGIF